MKTWFSSVNFTFLHWLEWALLFVRMSRRNLVNFFEIWLIFFEIFDIILIKWVFYIQLWKNIVNCCKRMNRQSKVQCAVEAMLTNICNRNLCISSHCFNQWNGISYAPVQLWQLTISKPIIHHITTHNK